MEIFLRKVQVYKTLKITSDFLDFLKTLSTLDRQVVIELFLRLNFAFCELYLRKFKKESLACKFQ